MPKSEITREEAEPPHTGAGRRKRILVSWVSIMDGCQDLFSLRFPKEIIVVDFTF